LLSGSLSGLTSLARERGWRKPLVDADSGVELARSVTQRITKLVVSCHQGPFLSSCGSSCVPVRTTAGSSLALFMSTRGRLRLTGRRSFPARGSSKRARWNRDCVRRPSPVRSVSAAIKEARSTVSLSRSRPCVLGPLALWLFIFHALGVPVVGSDCSTSFGTTGFRVLHLAGAAGSICRIASAGTGSVSVPFHFKPVPFHFKGGRPLGPPMGELSVLNSRSAACIRTFDVCLSEGCTGT